MAEEKKVGLTELGLKLRYLDRRIREELDPSNSHCLSCCCGSVELILLLESEGLDPKEVEAEAQKIAHDFMFVPKSKHQPSGRLTSGHSCGEAAYIPFFLAACYAVMSRKQ